MTPTRGFLAGTTMLPNVDGGIFANAKGTTIGGTSVGAGNLISGNGEEGLDIHTSCLVEGNRIEHLATISPGDG